MLKPWKLFFFISSYRFILLIIVGREGMNVWHTHTHNGMNRHTPWVQRWCRDGFWSKSTLSCEWCCTGCRDPSNGTGAVACEQGTQWQSSIIITHSFSQWVQDLYLHQGLMVETLLVSNDLQSYRLTHLMVKTLMSVCVCVCVHGGGKDRETDHD